MIALVTGSSGFVGRRLVAALRNDGASVGKLSERSVEPDVEKADLTDVVAVAGVLSKVRPDVVFHLHGAAAETEWSALVRVNVSAAAALLDAVERTGSNPVLVFVGSAAEYGQISPDALPATEETPLHPFTPYGISKRAQTDLALAASVRGRRVVVIRPSNIIGAGMPRQLALPSFAVQLARIERGLSPPVLAVGNLDSTRDFIDVADAVQDAIALSRNPSALGRVFNVSSGHGVCLGDALRLLIRIFDLSVEVREDPSRLRASDVSAFVASRERLEGILGPRPLVSLEESLRKLVEETRRRVVRDSSPEPSRG